MADLACLLVYQQDDLGKLQGRLHLTFRLKIQLSAPLSRLAVTRRRLIGLRYFGEHWSQLVMRLCFVAHKDVDVLVWLQRLRRLLKLTEVGRVGLLRQDVRYFLLLINIPHYLFDLKQI